MPKLCVYTPVMHRNTHEKCVLFIWEYAPFRHMMCFFYALGWCVTLHVENKASACQFLVCNAFFFAHKFTRGSQWVLQKINKMTCILLTHLIHDASNKMSKAKFTLPSCFCSVCFTAHAQNKEKKNPLQMLFESWYWQEKLQRGNLHYRLLFRSSGPFKLPVNWCKWTPIHFYGALFFASVQFLFFERKNGRSLQ